MPEDGGDNDGKEIKVEEGEPRCRVFDRGWAMRLRDRFPKLIGPLVMSDDEFWSLHPLRLRVIMGFVGGVFTLMGLLLWCLVAIGLGAGDLLVHHPVALGRVMPWSDLAALVVAALTLVVVGVAVLVLVFHRSVGVKRVVSLLCRYMPVLCVLTAVGVFASRDRYCAVFGICLLAIGSFPGLVLNRYVRWVKVK
ncbi:hypothetical protein [Bifidobacterium sp. ESL0800]|uniref:hypothetical protein n=1 Tax=Bifidobacterium sp. ESL0800 TaxID=2983236 RepID=UPI0023F8564A|nr:hypothetical protein [Bifidobacterium sp. ESL0800]WEV75008.1 hypothetical protein OZX75_04930 [Bifidobacterium sp. ESL0800]